MEVVEWLKWYRHAIKNIVSEKRIMDGSGTGYFDVLENDFYSAIKAAYYGPLIHSMDFLPDYFEADERSVPRTPVVLHLVSGQDLFGKMCVAKKVLQLSHARTYDSGIEMRSCDDHSCDAYKDLELHISGKIIDVANRVMSNEDCEDRIHVYINLHEDHKMFLGSINGLGTSGEEGSFFMHNN